MILIIPLGGLGTRFKKSGYTNPKPLINVLGKPILCWLLDYLVSLESFSRVLFVLIPYHRDLIPYEFESFLQNKYPNINFRFVKLLQNTKGAAHSLIYALESLTKEELNLPTLCLDGDNFYIECDVIDSWNCNNSIICVSDESSSNDYSFIKFDEKTLTILDIAEKDRISNFACTGGYGFSKAHDLYVFGKRIIRNDIKQKNEYYTSNIIREMMNTYNFNAIKLLTHNFICLGTPLHVHFFTNNYPAKSISKNRYCFDLDNTLVTYPKIINDYTTVEPIHKNIRILKYLKKLGHYIIIYTARRMKTHNNNNMGKVLKDIGKITFDTLDKYEIPYDEIYFGKPYADYYIDDKAISTYGDIEKELGFYINNVKPRYFNQISQCSIQLFHKSSLSSLYGEISYYQNIPVCLKDLFPVFFEYDPCNMWYTIEKIQGLTASVFYTTSEMTKSMIFNICYAIHRLHTTCIDKIDIMETSIYENYSKKLTHRFTNYDYSRFVSSNNVYLTLLKELQTYEQKKLGKLGRIHGDPVFTNIMINQFQKVKFIDMRGMQGNVATCFGDVFYDWAKMYQSLIGYDEILLNKELSLEYKNTCIAHFKEFFLKYYSNEMFEYVKIITKSLLFSLIPLHDNENCVDFYQLIQSQYLQSSL